MDFSLWRNQLEEIRGAWLRVTGPLHMPRAIASFQMGGFHVEPWPVYDDASSELSMVASALHEWVGLVTYRVLGRT